MKLGWIPDVPDKRDFLFPMAAAPVVLPPPKHRLVFPFVYDQGQLGSCTAQAVSAVFQYTELEQDGNAPIPSRLALYYWSRKEQGTTRYDSGASIRGAMKAASKYGMCRDELWPYDVGRFAYQPKAAARREASNHRMPGRAFARVDQTLDNLKAALVAGNPVAFGFAVYESFMSGAVARTGVVPMPKPVEKMSGGHAVVLVGYDEGKQVFIVKNSWGKGWGDEGYCTMPYAFILDQDLCADFWTIYKVPGLS